MKQRQHILLAAALFGFGFLFAAISVTISLQGKITQRLEKGWVLAPLELYSQGFFIAPGRKLPFETLIAEMEKRGWQKGRDYAVESVETCAESYAVEPSEKASSCLWIKEPAVALTWDDNFWITDVWSGVPLETAPSVSLFPKLITQFFEGQPILQQNTPLGEVPLACLQAVTAIEDRDFLEHRGVSATGILRAMLRNLKAGRFKEGGSTITQQLVKNFFLSPKKTIRRKLEEQVLAILLESQIGKDQILEMYLNVIYMGQSGPYQVRGLGSAASFYFDKSISQLDLPECALLAAVINSPGRYSPFEHKDAALARRELVLSKMTEAQMIGADEAAQAARAPLPVAEQGVRRVNAPYFVMQALQEFEDLELDADEGARLFTTLDPDVQTLASAALASTLPQIEARVKKPPQTPLQSAFVVVDLPSAQVLALAGGRDFKTSQFNRATDSRRQIGSVIKPFVYWPAMRDHDPLTSVEDAPFEWRAGKQVWKPKNYDGKMNGPVPYFYALANSLNTTAARVGQDVGLENVMLALGQSGVDLDIPLLPSITLGAVELSPLQLAQAYSTLGRFGEGDTVHSLERVESHSGEILFEHEPREDLQLDPIPTAVLVGMMRSTLDLGSGRAARAWGLQGDYAGKTGTTNDTKDAWFVGFNSRLLSVVWVGYDDNTTMGLTGAAAALPIWTEINKQLQSVFEPRPFTWPEGVEVRELNSGQVLEKFPQLKGLPDKFELIFAE